MDALPDFVLAAALAYCDPVALVAVESTSRHLHHVVQAQGLWATLSRRSVELGDHEAPASSLEWKRLAHVVGRPVDPTTSGLLEGVTDCSSIDRPDESPVKTLTYSRCWLSLSRVPEMVRDNPDLLVEWGARIQYYCNCMIGDSCYWSSAGTKDQNANDHIDYTVTGRSLVYLLSVIPYRAFWHPEAPTYSPRAVSFQFFSLVSDVTSDRVLVYESPVFPLENTMKLNSFKLPRPVWLPNGGTMRLNLHGRHQAQTVDLPTAPAASQPHYYSCLSYVGADGLTSVDLYPPGFDQHVDHAQQRPAPSRGELKRKADSKAFS